MSRRVAAVFLRPGLRTKLGATVLLAVAAFATFVVVQSRRELSSAYQKSGQRQVLAVARTFAEAADRGVPHRDEIQARLDRLRQQNPELVKASVYVIGDGRPVRLASTDRAALRKPAEAHDVAPLRTGTWHYEEERESGEHVGELTYPLRDGQGRPVAVVGLYFDLGPLDAALARSNRRFLLGAVTTAVLLVGLLSLLVGRLLLRPLETLRQATRRLAQGRFEARLGWRRSDELGELAGDFDDMAEQLADKHGRLERLALEDSLTGLPNHRSFQERLRQELERAAGEDRAVALVALDVDRFKAVNDGFGHSAGDDALRRVAGALREQLRDADLCGRVGGDEFMVALVDADVERARAVVGRLRAAVSELPLDHLDGRLTISAGIAAFPEHASDADELIRLADGALYRAKRDGRDRHAVFAPGAAHPLSAEEEAVAERRRGLLNTVRALAVAVDAKDGYTHTHSQRVARYAGVLADSLGFAPRHVEEISQAGLLHDVGKIAVPESILLKPGRLTEAEFEVMRRHSAIGRDIVANVGLPRIARWICHLHERIDGGGYPDGLAGDEIPMESRILAAADALEAMTSTRRYRVSMPLDRALEELACGAGRQFDAVVVERLIELVEHGELLVGDPAGEGIAV